LASWKGPEVELIQDSRLGRVSGFCSPPNYEANYFKSSEQRRARIEAQADGVLISYEKLWNEREEPPVKVRYRIRAVESRIEFSIEVDNPASLPLAEVLFGMLGASRASSTGPTPSRSFQAGRPITCRTSLPAFEAAATAAATWASVPRWPGSLTPAR
jgi:hypothetical protein